MKTLALDSSTARAALNWSDRLASKAGVEWTAAWYRAFACGDDMRAATLAQIDAFRRLPGQR
jgi:CDP-glucose 4,6-dehydratase